MRLVVAVLKLLRSVAVLTETRPVGGTRLLDARSVLVRTPCSCPSCSRIAGIRGLQGTPARLSGRYGPGKRLVLASTPSTGRLAEVRWIVKAAVQNTLAHMPRGRDINHLLQRKLTGSLPGDDDYFRLKARKAFWHFAALQQYLAGGEGGARLFEFGPGWDLVGPLIYYGLGVESQIVVDVAPNLRADLVAHSITQYSALRSELEASWGRPLRPLGEPSMRSSEELDERFGIRYLAPCGAQATDLPSDSVDFVSNTSVLQHVPEEQLAPILQECRRILRSGGVMSCHIDMPDGFAQFDHRLSPYNFLKFSDRTWALVNSPFYFHNRLRARDYVALFESAGFDVVKREDHRPTEQVKATLRGLRLAPRFRAYTADELAILQMSLVATRS